LVSVPPLGYIPVQATLIRATKKGQNKRRKCLLLSLGPSRERTIAGNSCIPSKEKRGNSSPATSKGTVSTPCIALVLFCIVPLSFVCLFLVRLGFELCTNNVGAIQLEPHFHLLWLFCRWGLVNYLLAWAALEPLSSSSQPPK
jgi:hypothetical protein